MKWHRPFAALVLVWSSAAIGCSGCSSATPTAEAETRSRDFIKLDPGKYKIEVKNTTFPVFEQNLEVKTRDEVTLKHRFQ